MAIDIDNLTELDLKHLWHPYTDINRYEEKPGVCFDSAEGSYLYTNDGQKVLDGIASWWCVALGHSNPLIVNAIREQAGILQQSILGNMSHPLAIRLAARLAELAPGDLNHCYFASDGASATEASLKMAIQYWHNVGEPQKVKFVSLEEGYHGDTLGAVGVGFVPTFHHFFEKAVKRSFAAPMPHRRSNPDTDLDLAHAQEAFSVMEGYVKEHHRDLAGVILEPLCQGAAGIRIYPAEYLRWVRELCDHYSLLLIADEIAVGFGRTGNMFACETAGITPDILCVGKALTGGYLPMSAAIASETIYNSFRSDDTHDRTFYDGHTYCGNPITSAAALAAIDIFTSQDIVGQAKPAASVLEKEFVEIACYPCVEYAKTLGTIAMCAFKQESGGADLARSIAEHAMGLGLFIRPLGEVLYLWPPLTASRDELGSMIELFKESIEITLNE